MSRVIAMRSGQKGVTLMELIFVVVIMGVLAGVAFPLLMSLREGIDSKGTARSLNSMLREARTKAGTLNRQYAVEFDLANRQYRKREGDRAYNSNWADIGLCPPRGGWVPFPPRVTMTLMDMPVVGLTGIVFSPNGTAQAIPFGATAKIEIKSDSGSTYRVEVSNIGSVRITQ